jgi:hypothetical protein
MSHDASTTGAAVLLVVEELMKRLQERNILDVEEVHQIMNVAAGSLDGAKSDLWRVIGNNGGG